MTIDQILEVRRVRLAFSWVTSYLLLGFDSGFGMATNASLFQALCTSRNVVRIYILVRKKASERGVPCGLAKMEGPFNNNHHPSEHYWGSGSRPSLWGEARLFIACVSEWIFHANCTESFEICWKHHANLGHFEARHTASKHPCHCLCSFMTKMIYHKVQSSPQEHETMKRISSRQWVNDLTLPSRFPSYFPLWLFELGMRTMPRISETICLFKGLNPWL